MKNKILLFIEKNYGLLLVIYCVISMLFVFCIENISIDSNGLKVSLFESIGDKSFGRGLFILTLTAVLGCFKIKDGKITIIQTRSTPRMR